MKFRPRFGAVAAIAAALLAPSVAEAGTTPWQNVAPGADLRVITSDNLVDGKTRIGLELRMDDGIKTYWRVPGETGIPAQVSLQGPGGTVPETIEWPFPSRLVTNGFVDNVYEGDLVLPISFTPPQGAQSLTLTADLGVCSDICVPVRAKIAVPLAFGHPDVAQNLKLIQAQAETPVAWSQQDGTAPIHAIRFDKAKKAVLLKYDPKTVQSDEIFVTMDGTALVYGEPKSVPGVHDELEVPLLARKIDADIDKHPIRVTFMTLKGPFTLVAGPATR